MGFVTAGLGSRAVDRQEGASARLWIGIVTAFVSVVGLVVFFLHNTTRMNVKDLFVDPAAKAGLGAHVGLFSHLGVLVLWTGATVLVGAALLGGHEPGARFLWSLGGLLAFLAIDDLYMVHEELGGAISRYIVPAMDRRVLEGVVFALYGLAWVVWVGWYRREILKGPAMLLLAALLSLGASVFIDVGEVFIEDWVRLDENRNTAFTVVEELLKLGGILFLASYAVNVSRKHLERQARPTSMLAAD